MNCETGSATLEVHLTRSKFVSLVQRLGDSAVSLKVSRGRFTADGVWLRLEITGDKSRIDEARRLCRSS